jgi:hypothetical protein
MIDYESPITQIVGEMQMEYENGVLKAVQNVGFHVDKEELTKALVYDRGQYEKGYKDGLNADRWIPCSERLPEEQDEYLVWWTADGFKGKCFYEIVEYHPEEGWIGKIPQAPFGKYTIIAWQPLPAPYQKGE